MAELKLRPFFSSSSLLTASSKIIPKMTCLQIACSSVLRKSPGCFLKRVNQLRKRELLFSLKHWKSLARYPLEPNWPLLCSRTSGEPSSRALKQIRNWVLTCPHTCASIVTINSLHPSHGFPSRLVCSHWTLRPCPSAWTVPPAAAAPWPIVHMGAALRQPTAGAVACHAHLYRLFASSRVSCLTQIPKSSSTTWLLPSFRILRLQKRWDHFIGVCAVGTGSKTCSLLGLLP